MNGCNAVLILRMLVLGCFLAVTASTDGRPGHLGFAVAQSVSEPWTLPRLQQELTKSTIETAAFEEIHYSHLLERPVRSRGRLTFKRPSTIEKHIVAPFEERYRIDGDTLLIENYRKGTRQTVLIDTYPSLKAFVEGFRGFITKNWSMLQQYYTIDLVGRRNDWTVKLYPLDVEFAKQIESIRFRGKAGTITAIEIWEQNGDHSEMTLTEAR